MIQRFFVLNPLQVLIIAQALEYARHNSPYVKSEDDQKQLQALEYQFRVALDGVQL